MESERVDRVSDLAPEYCHYHDEGCGFAVSCLNCPLPHCVYDQPRGEQSWLKRLRDTEMVRLFTIEGMKMKEIALKFCVSQRTVQRALRNISDKGGRVSNE